MHDPSSSSFSRTSQVSQHGRPRFNVGGAKMFSDALRGIVTSRNGESSNSLYNDELKNEAGLDRFANLEITVQVASDNSDEQKSHKRKITFSVSSENSSVNAEPIGSTSKNCVSSNQCLDSLFSSGDNLRQSFCTGYPLSSKENYSNYNLKNAVNTNVENKEKTQNFKSEHSIVNNNDVYDNSMSNENKKSTFKENTNNLSMRYPFFYSKKISDSLSTDKDCCSHRCVANDDKSNKTSEESKDIPKPSSSVNTRKTLVGKHKSLFRSSSVNKSEYFVPQNFLGKIYDFPVNPNYISPSSSTLSISEDGDKETASKSNIYPKQLCKNNVPDNNYDLLNNTFSANEIQTKNTGLNIRKELKELKWNNVSAVYQESSATVGDNKPYEKSFDVAKGHHVLLSEMFGPPKIFDNSFLENTTNNFCNSLKYNKDLNQRGIDTVDEHCKTLSVRYQSNNCENENLSENEILMEYEKATLPKKKDLCSSYSVPLLSQNKPEKYIIPALRGKHLKNDDASNKVNPITLGSYSNDLNETTCLKSTGSENAMSQSRNSSFQDLEKQLDTNDLFDIQNKSEKYVIPALRGKDVKSDVSSKLNSIALERYEGALNEVASFESTGSNNAMTKSNGSITLFTNAPREGLKKHLNTNYFSDGNDKEIDSVCQNFMRTLSLHSEMDCEKNMLQKQSSLNNNDSPHSSPSDCAISKRSVRAKQIAVPVEDYSSQSSSNESELSSSDYIRMNKKTVCTKQLAMQAKKLSNHSSLTKRNEEFGQLDHVASNTLNEQQSQDNCNRKLSTETISFWKFMNKHNFTFKSYTDYVVSPKHSRESNGDLPLSSSVLEVLPDILVGTCLVDTSESD